MMRFEGESSNTNGASKPFPPDSAAALAKGAMSKSINGSHRAISALNGSPATNRLSETVKRPSSIYFGHDREEVSRLLIQALLDLGYDSTAVNLIQESGFELEDPTVAAFRNAVLQGEWAEAEALLFRHSVASAEGDVNINNNGLVLAEGAEPDIMRFWLRQQKFLELLEAHDTSRALTVLRSELTPVYKNAHKLHFLSRFLPLYTLA